MMLFNVRLFSKIFYAIGLLFAVILMGTLGYYFLGDERWTLLDSFYMTIISISTVGFQEVHPLTPTGRLFTAMLIITSFGTFAYAISAITSYLVGGEYKIYFREYKVNKELNKLDNHVIVCGYGRVGKQAVADLRAYKQRFVILESNEDVIEKAQTADKDILFLHADATVDETLIRAGISRAKALITTMPSDSDNLFVVLSAAELNRKLKIISRAEKVSSVKKIKIAGAYNVIMPDRVGGSHMAQLVVTPDVMEFLDHISVQGEADCNLEEISFADLPEDYKYKTIQELDARKLTGCNIIGFRTASGEYIINPSPETKIGPNSMLFVLGNPSQIKKLNEIFGITLLNS